MTETVFLNAIFLMTFDKGRKLKYSSLQGKMFKTLEGSERFNHNESVVFWSEGVFYQKAEAVIHILLKLGRGYKIIGRILKIFPIFILNGAYDFVARYRYRLFGKRDMCLLPTSEEKNYLFLR
jgi:predicted DCC family thiol-disulfide oxidoreductase YuxK